MSSVIGAVAALELPKHLTVPVEWVIRRDPLELDGVGGHVYECDLLRIRAAAQRDSAQLDGSRPREVALRVGLGLPLDQRRLSEL